MSIQGIRSTELLEPGTTVYIKNMKGKVLKSCFEKDQFNVPICSHTIHYTEKCIDYHRNTWKPINKINKCNYSFIYIERG